MNQEELRVKICRFLNDHTKMVIGIVSPEMKVTTSLMLYAIDDNLNVFFGTRKSFNKYTSLLKNPAVSLTVVEAKPDPLVAVEIRGEAKEIASEKTAETLSFFESKNKNTYYVKDALDFVMFTLKPTFVRYLDAKSGELTLDHLTV